jgi:basic membrane protein A and related proteins
VKDALVSSAAKNVDAAVFSFLKSTSDGSVKPGIMTANLANGGIGLAPFHDWESKVPQELKDKIKEASDALVAGTLKTGYQP